MTKSLMYLFTSSLPKIIQNVRIGWKASKRNDAENEYASISGIGVGGTPNTSAIPNGSITKENPVGASFTVLGVPETFGSRTRSSNCTRASARFTFLIRAQRTNGRATLKTRTSTTTPGLFEAPTIAPVATSIPGGQGRAK